MEDTAESLRPRAPIITVMGHVDHGKTSILDFYRKANVVSGESGGITQHIGAYQVTTTHGPVCFLDTPGHEAFSAMRARGADITDVVLLVVAADSMVMPQTKEAITLAKNANCQIVVAINKVDLPTANQDKIKAQLAENGVQIEEYGGTIPCIAVSAKKGDNMDKLLETLALEAEVMELKANPDRPGVGVVIESRLDKGKGAVATVLVENGTLRVGDVFIAGTWSGKVRALLDERGQNRDEAGPSSPVQVLGLEGAPQAGDSFIVVGDEREAREIAGRRRMAAKERELRQKRHITLDQLYDQIKSGEFHELKVIIKGDVDGSVEAIATALEKLSTKEVRVNVISKGVGAVNDGDVHLAAASEALIIAFHVLPSEAVRNLAEIEGVTINNYRIIYEVVDEIKASMEGMLTPEVKEEVAGEAEILRIFNIPKVGIIAGSKVQSGSVERDLKARVYRNGIEVGEAKVTSLKREKDDVKTVKSGFECGIGLEGVKELKEGDVIAFFRKVEIARKLSPANACEDNRNHRSPGASMTRRTDRIGHLIQQEIGTLLLREISDSRIGFVTISRVDVTTDLAHAKVYVSVLGTDKEKRDSLAGLAHSSSYMRTHLSKVLKMRTVPRLQFVEDKNLDHGFRINQILNDIKREGGKAEPESDDA